MSTVLAAIIEQADEMAKTSKSGNGTAVADTAVGEVRVYRERDVKCMNMKRLATKTWWKLNGKVISVTKLETLLGE